jgi:hypothetical protein
MRRFLSNILKPFRTSSPTRSRGARPRLEHLEDRTVPVVTYHGGPLLRSVGVESVFFGSNWSSNPALTQQAGTLDAFLQDIVNSPYMDMLQNAGYGVGRGRFLNGIIDPVSLRRFVSDGQIENALAGLIASGGLQAPDANRLYVVFVQPGTEVFLPDGSNSHSDFLGYHGSFRGPTGAPVYYAVIPYPGGINASIPGLSNPIDGMTNVTSHELGEAVTDPAGDWGRIGWYDDANDGEIGDLVQGEYGYLDGYVVQAQADRYDRPMLPSTAPANPAPPTGTGGGQDVTSPSAWPGVSLGAYDPSAATWHLSTQNAQGVPDIAPFAYGAPGWIPVSGSWSRPAATTPATTASREVSSNLASDLQVTGLRRTWALDHVFAGGSL